MANLSIEQSPTTAVWEIRSRKASDPASRVILCAAREYQTKASLALDSVLDLRVENYKLRKTFVELLQKKGLDPGTHPLLQDPRKDQGLAKGLFPPALQIGSTMAQSSLSTASDSPTTLSSTNNNAFGQPISSSGRTPQTGVGSSLSSNASFHLQSGPLSASHMEPGSVKVSAGSSRHPPGSLPSIVCRHCGTQESPEWRKGPDGPRTWVFCPAALFKVSFFLYEYIDSATPVALHTRKNFGNCGGWNRAFQVRQPRRPKWYCLWTKLVAHIWQRD
jgi:hypothetical protein